MSAWGASAAIARLRRTLVAALLAATGAAPPALADYPWTHASGAEPLAERIPPPAECTEEPAAPGSFGAWLRGLPLAPDGTRVRDGDGDVVWFPFSPVVAVVDLDLLGPQDCADTAIRLRAEYLWQRDAVADLSFRYLSGDEVPWRRWAEGCRPELDAAHRRVERWRCGEAVSRSHETFRAYLANVMRYANSASLARDLVSIAPDELAPGDVVVQPDPAGRPGHVVVVARAARCASGERRYVLVNGFLPAQSAHVIGRRRLFGGGGAWFTWTELRSHLRPLGARFEPRRFPEPGAGAAVTRSR